MTTDALAVSNQTRPAAHHVIASRLQRAAVVMGGPAEPGYCMASL